MTRHLYVVGHPVAHSKSPVMHNAAYAALGLDWEYGLADCATSEDARRFIAEGEWLALNVTMPYKPLALAASARASASARLAGGANVVVKSAGQLRADNTDGRGCIAFLRRCGVAFEDASVIICGTGPTSRSLMHAASLAGAARCILLSRDGDKARAALEDYSACASQEGVLPATGFEAASYEEGRDALAGADVILDATPLGMKPGDPAPFDTSLLGADQAVFDVVYGHGETALMRAARAAGCRAFDGAGMLVAQAVETVVDIVEWLDVPVRLDVVDLYAAMAQAAFPSWPVAG